MEKRFKAIFAAAVLGPLLAGCYSFNGGKLDFKTVGIPVAENTTGDYRLTDAMTTAMINAVNMDGRAKISDVDRAEAVLELSVTGYSRIPYEYTGQEQVNQYKVTITAKGKLRSPAGKILWESQSVSAWSTYSASDSDEETGMKKAAENLAAEVIRQAFETW